MANLNWHQGYHRLHVWELDHFSNWRSFRHWFSFSWMSTFILKSETDSTDVAMTGSQFGTFVPLFGKFCLGDNFQLSPELSPTPCLRTRHLIARLWGLPNMLFVFFSIRQLAQQTTRLLISLTITILYTIKRYWLEDFSDPCSPAVIRRLCRCLPHYAMSLTVGELSISVLKVLRDRRPTKQCSC